MISYERPLWVDVRQKLERGIGEGGLIIERADTGDAIGSEVHWQVLFDAVIDDWHGVGKLGGEMLLCANRRGLRKMSGNASVGVGEQQMILSINTRTLDDKVWGRWGKNGLVMMPSRSKTEKDTSKAAGEKHGSGQGGFLEMQGMESVRNVDELRQRLCDQFGKCVVLVWVPCDINGKLKNSGEDSLLRAITNNSAWNAAQNEVMPPILFLTFDLFLSIISAFG